MVTMCDIYVRHHAWQTRSLKNGLHCVTASENCRTAAWTPTRHQRLHLMTMTAVLILMMRPLTTMIYCKLYFDSDGWEHEETIEPVISVFSHLVYSD